MTEFQDTPVEQEVKGTVTNVKIGDDVVAVIAGLAASEVPGVAGMSGGIAGGIAELVGRKNLSKGIKVELRENQAIIGINIVVNYGSKIPEVAAAIQEAVKNAVETMTGLLVAEINVYVQGVVFPQAVPEAAADTEAAPE